MTKIVFIHGRGQKDRNHEELRQVWLGAMKKGLAAHSFQMPPDIKVVLPFYGVELDQLRKNYDPRTASHLVTEKGGPLPDDEALYLQLLTEVAQNAGLTQKDIEQEYTLSVQEKGIQNWEWVHAIARAIDNKRRLGELTIKLFTRDVFDYLTKPVIRDRINSIVLNEIGDEPCLVIAHSLGSIVGYNVLHENPMLNIKGFITVGSPLALHAIGGRINTPLKINCIKGRWFNAYDEKDIVALRPLTKEFFNIDPEVFNYAFVDNNYSDHHGIEGYLSDAIVSEEIIRHLTPDQKQL